MKLSNKIVLVTGGSSGIGAAAVDKLISEGATVINGDISNPAMTLEGAGRSRALHLDVSNPESIQQCVDAIKAEFGRLDALVHSAGVGMERPFFDTTVADLDRIMGINVRGTFLLGQAVARIMVDQGGGAIVNIASVSGMIGNGGRSAYGSSKGAMISLSKIMAVELAPRNVRVNVVSPGPVLTPMAEKAHSAKTRAEWNARVALGRYGTPEEIANVTAFLASDESSYMTGEVIAVDGGFLMKGLSAAVA